jgi:hypothetical protein
MKKQAPPKSVLFLTSDQFEDALVKGFQRFVQSTSHLYQENPMMRPDTLIHRTKREGKGRSGEKNDSQRQRWDNKRTHQKLVLKGHVPIRSQIGHDRDRA